MRPRRACSRSPAASSRPGGGWRSRSSTGWSSAPGRVAPCRTADIPLGMAADEADLDRARRARRGRPSRGLPRAAALPLRPRRRAACCRSPAESPGSRGRSSTASPTCSPRPRSPRGSSRRRASPTSCCAAPGSGCWRRRSCAAPTSVMPVAEVLGRGARLGRAARSGAEAERWSDDAASEGIDPAIGVTSSA